MVGNPGTGKSTVGKIMSEIMESLGFRDGKLARFTGTVLADMGAPAFVKDVLTPLKNGVLFVDEAYQLDPKGPAGATGQKILDALMDFTDVNKRTATVIFAGYEAQVRDVIASNTGFPRRFQYTFNFEDYTETEIRKLYRFYVKKRGFVLPPRAACGPQQPWVGGLAGAATVVSCARDATAGGWVEEPA